MKYRVLKLKESLASQPLRLSKQEKAENLQYKKWNLFASLFFSTGEDTLLSHSLRGFLWVIHFLALQILI